MRAKRVELGNANAPLTANRLCDDGKDGGCHEADSLGRPSFFFSPFHIKSSSIAAAELMSLERRDDGFKIRDHVI